MKIRLYWSENEGSRDERGRKGSCHQVGQHQTDPADAQDNTLALSGNTGGLQDSYKYFPYGDIRISIGSHNNPFRYGGRWANFYDSPARTYVRRRVLDTKTGSWMTVDPLWPQQPPYVYCNCAPVTHIDKSGYSIVIDSSCCERKSLYELYARDNCDDIKRVIPVASGKPPKDAINSVRDCLKLKNFDFPEAVVSDYMQLYASWCTAAGRHSNACFLCRDGLSSLPAGCDPCKNNPGAVTVFSSLANIDSLKNVLQRAEDFVCGIPQHLGDPSSPCAPLHNKQNCECTVVICAEYHSGGFYQMMIHELTHCATAGGPPNHNVHVDKTGSRFINPDAIYAMSCCICEHVYGKGSKDCGDCRPFSK